MTVYYPFTAIVGQEPLKRALILNAVNPEIGGLLIRGDSGIGKSTAVRGLTQLLPEIQVVSDCPFHCDPLDVSLQCTACKNRSRNGENLPVKTLPLPMVDLPLNATEDRVTGTLDISRAIKEGLRALEPGLLAEANRGILYVDEINLLDDHIVDLLLDAAAFGINVVEREGISVRHPARFLLIGTMNPEEGELRPQIADRIGLQIEITALKELDQRVEVMKRRENFVKNPEDFEDKYSEQQNGLKYNIQQAMERLPEVITDDVFYNAIARLTLKSEVSSHRSDITILECAKAMAALEGRKKVEAKDIFPAAQMALAHRLPYDPSTEGPKLDPHDIRRDLEDIIDMEFEVKKKHEI